MNCWLCGSTIASDGSKTRLEVALWHTKKGSGAVTRLEVALWHTKKVGGAVTRLQVARKHTSMIWRFVDTPFEEVVK